MVCDYSKQAGVSFTFLAFARSGNGRLKKIIGDQHSWCVMVSFKQHRLPITVITDSWIGLHSPSTAWLTVQSSNAGRIVGSGRKGVKGLV